MQVRHSSKYYFEMAQEIRALADKLDSVTEREDALRLADDYQKLGTTTRAFEERIGRTSDKES